MFVKRWYVDGVGVGNDEMSGRALGSGPSYNEPIIGKRWPKRGMTSMAMFSKSDINWLCGMEWNTLPRGIPGA